MFGKVAKSPFGPADRLGLSTAPGDGPDQYSNLLTISSLLVNRKPLGQQNVAGDDATGRLAVPNPMYTGRGTNLEQMPGSALHTERAWRNHFRWNQHQRRGYDTHVFFTQQYQRDTPIALPNTLPIHIHPNPL